MKCCPCDHALFLDLCAAAFLDDSNLRSPPQKSRTLSPTKGLFFHTWMLRILWNSFGWQRYSESKLKPTYTNLRVYQLRRSIYQQIYQFTSKKLLPLLTGKNLFTGKPFSAHFPLISALMSLKMPVKWFVVLKTFISASLACWIVSF